MLHRAKTGQTEILAEDAAYAAMAPGMVVWEGRTNGQTTVLAKALE
jgi:hypothetical protein